jgi:hypothetical protein
VVHIVTTVVYRIGEQCLSDSSSVQGTVCVYKDIHSRIVGSRLKHCQVVL